uniref:hypothetical protein n=2 Tax=Bacteroides finegoldii TaxID=338188 RepID=UPI0034A54C58
MKDNILKEYTQKKNLFEKLSNKLEMLIDEFLKENKTIIRFFVKFGGNLFFISPVFFFLNPIKSC